jgi:ABC-type nitrate/sulfonate/bicarbonate transport system permease component
VLLSPAVAGLIGIVVLLAILQGLIVAGLIPKVIVAKPTDAIASIPELHEKSDLVYNFAVTFGMTFAATALAVLVGVPFGFLMFRNRVIGEAYEGWLAAAFAAPMVLLYPLFLVIFGRTYLTVVLMAFVPGSIPIIIQTRQGLLNVSRTLVNVGRSFSVSTRDMFWKIMFPAAVPTIFNGIRLGIMYALVNVVAIEYLTDFGGLGRIVSDLYFRYEIPATYAAIGFVILVSVTFYWALGKVERWLRPV